MAHSRFAKQQSRSMKSKARPIKRICYTQEETQDIFTTTWPILPIVHELKKETSFPSRSMTGTTTDSRGEWQNRPWKEKSSTASNLQCKPRVKYKASATHQYESQSKKVEPDQAKTLIWISIQGHNEHWRFFSMYHTSRITWAALCNLLLMPMRMLRIFTKYIISKGERERGRGRILPTRGAAGSGG